MPLITASANGLKNEMPYIPVRVSIVLAAAPSSASSFSPKEQFIRRTGPAPVTMSSQASKCMSLYSLVSRITRSFLTVFRVSLIASMLTKLVWEPFGDGDPFGSTGYGPRRSEVLGHVPSHQNTSQLCPACDRRRDSRVVSAVRAEAERIHASVEGE